MSLFKFLALGAAVAVGVNYITKKGTNGRSIVDDLSDKAPEWMDKAKPYVDKVKDQFGGRTSQETSGSSSTNSYGSMPS